MSSVLPTENAADKAVQEFGLGMYDSDQTGPHGEDDNGFPSESDAEGVSLPDGFTNPSLISSSRMIIDANGRVMSRDELVKEMAASIIDAAQRATSVLSLPGDVNRPTTHQHPATNNIGPGVMSVAESELPEDSENPSARSDYYDKMNIGMGGDEWADEDSGAYAASDVPGVMKNEVAMDDFLSSLGNFWSGYTVDDVSGPYGHPSYDFAENVDYIHDGGSIVAGASMNSKTATNHELVGRLTSEFLKKFGKKDLTRRHIMAFLQAEGQHQYLASDVIRCLKLRHSIYVKDVLDEFPVMKTASMSLSSIAVKLKRMEESSIPGSDTRRKLSECIAHIRNASAYLGRSGGRNG